ncbi:MAG: response regulator [Anaerolineae bacterium]
MLLAYRFLEGRDIGDICHELGYSRRQFFREQRKALARLVALLADKVPQDLGQPVAGTDLLLVEVERVLAARESIHLQDAIDGILAAIGPLASQRRVRVRFVLDERLPPIYGNRTLLRQALLRTLSAMTTRPGVEEVLLSGHKSAGGVEISVVAKRDGKAALSESSSDEGVQTVRRFVQMMGGRWLATDTQSTADAYRFWLPTDQQQVLLVVEDNDAVVHAFRRYLASYGYQVVGVRNASEAIRLAKETSVVAIALDVMMPLQDGWEVLQELKRDQATSRIPVIVCSVLDDPDLAFSLGAAWYLHKPVSQADLVSALEAVTTANA